MSPRPSLWSPDGRDKREPQQLLLSFILSPPATERRTSPSFLFVAYFMSQRFEISDWVLGHAELYDEAASQYRKWEYPNCA
jgi:hypothetical protein